MVSIHPRTSPPKICKIKICKILKNVSNLKFCQFPQQVRVAWFSFSTVCDRALGAGDYLAIAEAFPTVFLDDVPNLTLQERDQV